MKRETFESMQKRAERALRFPLILNNNFGDGLVPKDGEERTGKVPILSRIIVTIGGLAGFGAIGQVMSEHLNTHNSWPAAPADTAGACTYTVRPFDNLTGIAGTWDTTVEKLMVTNSITDPRRLQIGTVLAIPDCDPNSGRGGLLSSNNQELLTSYSGLIDLSKTSDDGLDWSKMERQWIGRGMEYVVGFALDRGVPPEWLRSVLKKVVIYKTAWNEDPSATNFYETDPATGEIWMPGGYPGTWVLGHELIHSLAWFGVGSINEGFAQYFSYEMTYGSGEYGEPFLGCQGIAKVAGSDKTDYARAVSQTQGFARALKNGAKITPKYDYIGIVTEIYARWVVVPTHTGTPMPTSWFMSQVGQYYGLKSGAVAEIVKGFPLFACRE